MGRGIGVGGGGRRRRREAEGEGGGVRKEEGTRNLLHKNNQMK